MQTKIEASTEAWGRVARAMVDRRTVLGMTQEQLAGEASVSPTTVRYLETSARTSYRALTLARVAAALDWPSTRFVEILAGAEGDEPEPTNLGDDVRDQRLNDLEARVDELTAMVRAIYDRLVPANHATPTPPTPHPPATRPRPAGTPSPPAKRQARRRL